MQQTINRMNEKIQKGEGENRISILMANQNEQYARSHRIRIYRLPEPENEDCKQTVINLLTSKLDIHDIRAQDKKSNDGKPKSMILSFFRRDHKKRILENIRKLKGSHIVIVEDLTRLNNGLMNRLRQDHRIESVWSWEGSMRVKLREGDP